MANHQAKCWPEPFQAILDNKKNFDCRFGKEWQEGDVVLLEEYEPNPDAEHSVVPTGRSVSVVITYVLKLEDMAKYYSKQFTSDMIPDFRVYSIRVLAP